LLAQRKAQQTRSPALDSATKLAFPSHLAQVKVIAPSHKTDAINFFRLSRKTIAFSSHSAQVEAIANLSPTDAIAFFHFRQKIAYNYLIQEKSVANPN
jgi:hypothetical protein